MNEIINTLRQRAKKVNAKIVLPEPADTRIIEAAAYISKEKIAKIVLLGDRDEVKSSLKKYNADMNELEIINPAKSSFFEKYTDIFYELRKHKGISRDEAMAMLKQEPLYYGALMVKEKQANGFVAGAIHTTRDVARSVLWCIGIDKAIRTMSSSFIMILPDRDFGSEGVLVYADCGIVPYPNPRQLASIAIASSGLMQALFEVSPKIAMLSFSTKGSGVSEEREKILKAIEIVKNLRPDLIIDGELQADAAIVPEVAKIKAPNSPLKGLSNVLIFPNLEAGNISYKLTQRLANARALGPLLQGLNAPCSDLSRGCSAEDIIDIVAVTALRSAANSKS